MSLKFAAVGNLMVLQVLEYRALRDRSKIGFNAVSPTETYDPLLAMIGRGRREAETKQPQAAERTANEARW